MNVRKITQLPRMVGRVAGYDPYDAPEGWPNGTAVHVAENSGTLSASEIPKAGKPTFPIGA